jgi:hypothetical protein
VSPPPEVRVYLEEINTWRFVKNKSLFHENQLGKDTVVLKNPEKPKKPT